MNRLRAGFYLFLICFTVSCSGSLVSGTESGEPVNPLAGFTDFPDSLFEGLYLGQPLADARNNLLQNGFEAVDSSGSFNYWRQGDSIEVIVPDAAKIRTLKIMLHSTACLAAKQRLLNGFSASAERARQSAQFSVFDYQCNDLDFKLTVFSQKDFIRLNFEQQISK